MARQYIPTDPLFGQQWFLNNTGQATVAGPQAAGAPRNDIDVTSVWPNYTGSGVLVGVIDDGFDGANPDLAPNYRTDLAYDTELNRAGAGPVDEDPEQPDNHGTPVAGLIAEAQNGIGGVGVAFAAKLAAFRGTADTFAAAADRALADGVQVLNNSYGAVTGDKPLGANAQQPTLNAAMLKLATSGRNGLGTVTIWSGGNDRKVGFLTSYDASNSNPYAINIAAATVDGTVADYSTQGPNLLVAAPGSEPASIVTTDRSGTAGDNTAPDGDYTNTAASAFNGTSAAAPIASGVVALMLQANPNLGYRDVMEILADSARQPTTMAVTTQALTTDWNGGLHPYSADLGFGNIDALAAVRLAETWRQQDTVANITTATLAGQTGAVAPDSTASFVATAASPQPAVRTEHIVVAVDLTAGSLQDVTLTLLGGNTVLGSTNAATLFDRPNIATPMTRLTYSFDVTADWGYVSSPSTSFTLQVTDASQTAPVTLNSYSVSLLGAAAGPSHTYVYTNDYARFAAADPTRATLDDPSAGMQTINAAAVTGNSVIDLRGQGQAGSLGGAPFTVAGDTAVQSVFTGDGDDTIYGNALDNTLGAGRGTNTIDGGGGTNTAVLIGARAGYTLGLAGGNVTVDSTDGVTADTLRNVQTLAFGDTNVDLSQALSGKIGVGQGAGDFGAAYSGPVGGLQRQFVADSSSNLSLTATQNSVFLVGGAGEDALTALGGSNVLDGGGNSSFFVGASGSDGGTDTFFNDGLLFGAAATWDTLVNFHVGDELTVWGYNAGRDSYVLQGGMGAAGYTGNTLEVTDPGRSNPFLFTFAGLTASDHLIVSTGTASGDPYLAVSHVA